jgi:hypothetical protein
MPLLQTRETQDRTATAAEGPSRPALPRSPVGRGSPRTSSHINRTHSVHRRELALFPPLPATSRGGSERLLRMRLV